jgi:hypothetical protein
VGTHADDDADCKHEPERGETGAREILHVAESRSQSFTVCLCEAILRLLSNSWPFIGRRSRGVWRLEVGDEVDDRERKPNPQIRLGPRGRVDSLANM